jgi:uroporphyrinogen III methyltransferase/synthase
LKGKRIVITRSREQAGELADKVRAHGGIPVLFPTVEFAAVDDLNALDTALASARDYDWVVFTSANGVRAVHARLARMGADRPVFTPARLAAIGPGTARALEALGLSVDFVPTKFLGSQIARELPVEPGQRTLLLRADLASPILAEGLTARGVIVSNVTAYRTVRPPSRPLALDRVDAVTCTSSSTARHFVELLDDGARESLRMLDVFCIGPVTAATARKLGLPVSAVAGEHTLDGLVAAMLDYYERNIGNVKARVDHRAAA